jgi:hypothetical protein
VIACRITIFRETAFTLRVNVKDSAGNPFDLTGWSAKAEVRKAYSKELLAAMGIVFPNAVFGSVALSIPAAATAGLALQQARWDLLLFSPAPDLVPVGPIIGGAAFIAAPITQVAA